MPIFNTQQQREIERLVKDYLERGNALDINARSYLRYFTIFESVDRLSTTAGGSNQTTDTDGLFLEVDSGSSDETELISLITNDDTLIRHDRETIIKTAMKVNSGSDLDVSMSALGVSDGYIEFLISDGVLTGRSNDGTTTKSVTLISSISVDTFYTLEAHLFPKDKIVFKVNGIERGTIRENLPAGSPAQMFNFSLLRTAGTATKSGHAAFFELVQARI